MEGNLKIILFFDRNEEYYIGISNICFMVFTALNSKVI